MIGFLNNLSDNILVLNKAKKIVFLNNTFLSSLYIKRDDINLECINRMISISGNKIYFKNEDNLIELGFCHFSKIQWDNEEVEIAIVKLKNKFNNDIKLKIIEEFLNQSDNFICIRNLKNEIIYSNKGDKNYLDIYNKHIDSTIESVLEDEEIKELVNSKNKYVVESKKKCAFEVNKERNNIKSYYSIKKYPILNKIGNVEYIGTLVEDISLNKNIQYKILDNLNLIDSNEISNLRLKNVDESIFLNFRNLFYKYLDTQYFNIWIYDEDKNTLNPKFDINTVFENFSIKDSYEVNPEDKERFLQNNYKKVFEVRNINLDNHNKKQTYYVLNYPIINQSEFKGLISLAYKNYPEEDIIDSDIIRSTCNQIGFIIKYMEMSKKIIDELKHRSEIENILEEFLEVSADIIFMADSSGIKYVGKRCFDILGWTEEEFKKLYPNEIVHPDDIGKTLRVIEEQVNTDDMLQLENRVKCSSGCGKWISWRSKNLLDSKGYIFASGKDITCEKIVDEKEKEIEKNKHLEEVRNEFFANISHEFKTPINMIMATSQLMKQKLDTYNLKNDIENEVRKHINIFRQNGYRLLRLVNNLIDITKIDSGFYMIKPMNVNIISVVEDIVLSVAEFCMENKILLTFDTEVEEEIIACDPDQIERIILNLLSNSIKFTPKSGEIKVNIYVEDEYVVIIVKDTGKGIPKEKLEVIFERFIQCENTLTRTCEGSGIGLSLVKGIVDMHEGNIKVSSEEGSGSSFEIRLPRKRLNSDKDYLINDSEVKQSKIEKCSIEFADIYNFNI